MIKNIVFDLGGVVLDLNYNLNIESRNYDKKLVDLLKSIYISEEWSNLDKGIYAIEDLIEIFCARNPEYAKEIEDVIGDDVKNVFPIRKNTVEFVKDLKSQGYNIYILSNIFEKVIEYVTGNKDFYENVSGEIFSNRVKMIKPNKDIYLELLEKYRLNPDETIFIDDKISNIDTANLLHIRGIVFTNLEDTKEKVYEIIKKS
jgi:putative hydrolase of the HAD superfamily